MRHRRFPLAVALLVCLSLPMLAFSDLEGHWAEEAIEAMAEEGIVEGYEDGDFRPDGIVTRVEFIAMLNRAADLDPLAGTVIFSDVVSSDWFAGDVKAALNEGYLQSNRANNQLDPNGEIPRWEAAVLLGRLANYSEFGDDSFLNGFSDKAEIPSASVGLIASVIEEEVMNGYPDDTFRPGATITRAEAVVIIRRALEAIEDAMEEEEED